MIGGAAVLAALALVLLRAPSPGAARLRVLWGRPGRVPVGRVRPRIPVGVLLPAMVGAGAMASWSGLGYGVAVPVLPAAVGGVAGATAAVVAAGVARERRRGRGAAALVEAVSTLAGDLRAGQQPAEALATVAGDPRWLPATRHRAVTAVWTVAERSGAPAAAVLDRVEQDLRSREQQRREVAAQLAGARSTAGLLAVLPLLGIALGAAIGAAPLGVLLGDPRGHLALLVGVALEAVGLLWTSRIVARAQASP